jgi:uncharacterized tellurite resistance protein B-like protein
MQRLTKHDRLQLLRFVCSFAWADFEVQPEEREYVARLIRKLHMTPDEAEQVEKWLKVPPRPDEVDPTKIPREHRELFLNTVRELVMADGVLAPEEQENLRLFEELVRGS